MQCDADVHEDFCRTADEDGMEDALFMFVHTMRNARGVDPALMYHSLLVHLFCLPAEVLSVLMESNTIRFFSSALQYLIECDNETPKTWSNRLVPVPGDCISTLRLKAWILDRTWGLLDQDLFRPHATLHPDADEWLHFTQFSNTLASICA